MRFGPTSIQVSSVLSKGLRRPKLRSDLRISEQTVNGEKSYVIKNHETNSYNRYGEFEYQLLMLCDGTRTPAEISEALSEQDPDSAIAESEVLEFLDSIEPAMWERSLGEKNLAVLERIRDERKGRVDQSSMLYIGFKAWDPNKTLEKLEPYLSWIYTTQFVFFCILMFITAAYFVAGDWTRVQRDTSSLYSFADKSAYDVWAFWILLLMIGAIHEFGHGLTCKHFGGDVHQMGFLLIYLTPAFYTDTTDILLFDRTSRRQWVIFAGIWVELVLCSISVVIWHFTAPGSIVNDLAYKAMLLSGIQGALINLNPLIKADGYYALSQFLDIDNLREESFAFLRVWFQKYILRRDIDLPPSSRRHRRIFLCLRRCRDLLQRSSPRRRPVIRKECPCHPNSETGATFCLQVWFTFLPKRHQVISAYRSRLDSKTAGVLYDLEIYARSDLWRSGSRSAFICAASSHQCLLRAPSRTW